MKKKEEEELFKIKEKRVEIIVFVLFFLFTMSSYIFILNSVEKKQKEQTKILNEVLFENKFENIKKITNENLITLLKLNKNIELGNEVDLNKTEGILKELILTKKYEGQENLKENIFFELHELNKLFKFEKYADKELFEKTLNNINSEELTILKEIILKRHTLEKELNYNKSINKEKK